MKDGSAFELAGDDLIAKFGCLCLIEHLCSLYFLFYDIVFVF